MYFRLVQEQGVAILWSAYELLDSVPFTLVTYFTGTHVKRVRTATPISTSPSLLAHPDCNSRDTEQGSTSSWSRTGRSRITRQSRLGVTTGVYSGEKGDVADARSFPSARLETPPASVLYSSSCARSSGSMVNTTEQEREPTSALTQNASAASNEKLDGGYHDVPITSACPHNGLFAAVLFTHRLVLLTQLSKSA